MSLGNRLSIGILLVSLGCQTSGQRATLESPAPVLGNAAATASPMPEGLSREQELRLDAVARLAAEDLQAAQEPARETAASATERASQGLVNVSRDVRPDWRR